MNRMQTIVFATALAAATTASAQTCSGGADGGMDASGCQCNVPDLLVAADVVTVAAEARVEPTKPARAVPEPRPAREPKRAVAREAIDKRHVIAGR